MRDAEDLYERFTGHRAGYVDKHADAHFQTGLKVGSIDGILYTTVRDGVTEHYIHKFKKTSRPALAVSHDGKKFQAVGGRFEFTERGFIDR